MLKYVVSDIVFAEVPDQITLAIDISGCPCNCRGCHSPMLSQDVGKPLTTMALNELIDDSYRFITCVCFMGGDADPDYISELARHVKKTYPALEVAWYSGRQQLPLHMDTRHLDYVKLGPYKEERGPISRIGSNQKMFRLHNGILADDITYKFWK